MTKERAIKDYEESGLVIFLARHGKVPVQSLDPTLKTEMAALQHNYNAEQLKIFYVIRTTATQSCWRGFRKLLLRENENRCCAEKAFEPVVIETHAQTMTDERDGTV